MNNWIDFETTATQLSGYGIMIQPVKVKTDMLDLLIASDNTDQYIETIKKGIDQGWIINQGPPFEDF